MAASETGSACFTVLVSKYRNECHPGCERSMPQRDRGTGRVSPAVGECQRQAHRPSRPGRARGSRGNSPSRIRAFSRVRGRKGGAGRRGNGTGPGIPSGPGAPDPGRHLEFRGRCVREPGTSNDGGPADQDGGGVGGVDVVDRQRGDSRPSVPPGRWETETRGLGGMSSTST